MRIFSRLSASFTAPFLIGVLLIQFCSASCVSVVSARGSSMWPTIHDGDEIALLKAPVLFLFIKRGDIITFRDPSGEEQIPLAKRVIGLPGDVVHLKDGKVFVNDGELDESYLLIHDPEVELLCRVPPAAYFVLGDNRPGSLDSSRLGPIPVSLIKGKVLTIGPHIMVRDLVARSN